ncbi:hypothetical protein TeGR_g13667, partial [Tetraparma gracilis]
MASPKPSSPFSFLTPAGKKSRPARPLTPPWGNTDFPSPPPEPRDHKDSVDTTSTLSDLEGDNDQLNQSAHLDGLLDLEGFEEVPGEGVDGGDPVEGLRVELERLEYELEKAREGLDLERASSNDTKAGGGARSPSAAAGADDVDLRRRAKQARAALKAAKKRRMKQQKLEAEADADAEAGRASEDAFRDVAEGEEKEEGVGGRTRTDSVLSDGGTDKTPRHRAFRILKEKGELQQ